MKHYWANIHGTWVDLTEAHAYISDAVFGAATEGELAFDDGFVEIRLDDKTHYVHRSCIQVTKD